MTLRTLLIALLLTAALTVPADGSETQTRRYVATPPAPGGVLLSLCESGCDLDGAGGTDPLSVGRLAFTFAAPHNNFLVTTDEEAPIATCALDPATDPLCTPDGGFGSDWTCGTAALLGSPFATQELTVWVTTHLVREDLAVCVGTTGTATAYAF